MKATAYLIAHTVATLAGSWNALADGAHSLRIEDDFVIGLAIVGVVDECCGGGFYYEANARSLYGNGATAELDARGDVKTLAEAKELAETALYDYSNAVAETVTD